MAGMVRTALLAAASMLAVGAGAASADQYFFRTKPDVSRPQAFNFGSKANQIPGDVVASEVSPVKGHRSAQISVTGPTGASFQVCSKADCSDQGQSWSTSPTTGPSDAFYARVRAQAGTFGETAVVSLSVGGQVGTFSIASRAADLAPDAFSFTTVADADAGTERLSSVVRLTGHDGVPVSVSGATASYRLCAASDCSDQANGGWGTANRTATSGQYAQLRMTAPVAGQTQEARLEAGSTAASWSVTSKAAAPAFAGHVFTTCGAAGPNGPTLAACQSAYSGTAAGSTLAMAKQGFQTWTVPATRKYRIDVSGARGGNIKAYKGGQGARLLVDVDLVAGAKLTMMVGQTGTGGGEGSGGGGASAVFLADGTPLVVAGGGGGANSPSPGASNGYDANAASTNGVSSTGEVNGCGSGANLTIPGGTNGSGGGGGCAAGGGGVSGNGVTTANSGGGASLSGSAVGGASLNNRANAAGGFGGGGSGMDGQGYGGGGGGYSGGAGGGYASGGRQYPGGGGGSYTKPGTSVFALTVNTETAGSVSVTGI